MRRSVADRFKSKVVIDPHTGCWLWCGFVARDGYGRFSVDGRITMAHRFAYELFIGPMPDGLVPDHLCRTRRCVNPAHIEPVTVGENTRRGTAAHHVRLRNAAITHCPLGHPYDGDNLSLDARGRRRCKQCHREQQRAYIERKAMA